MLHLTFFSFFGVVLVLMLTVMWMIVAAKTLAGAYRGNLFVSPCIHSLSKASKT
ncbi:hypothetical protein ALO82_200310 [Pseudomonas syringae pv. broussonetiae]|jgi:hypothetical protein|nr:hypothetical protein [Acinetobacter cumulans]KPW48397.1 hypothetical protein ALO82_200310 [Pseudomonas syringae pv. broussonetiae]